VSVISLSLLVELELRTLVGGSTYIVPRCLQVTCWADFGLTVKPAPTPSLGLQNTSLGTHRRLRAMPCFEVTKTGGTVCSGGGAADASIPARRDRARSREIGFIAAKTWDLD
jgi:hypothetical protein